MDLRAGLLCCLVTVAAAQDCYRPEVPPYATLAPSSGDYYAGDTITYGCSEGRVLIEGDSSRDCGKDGVWSGKSPFCLPPGEICNGIRISLNQCLYLTDPMPWKGAADKCGKDGSLLTLTDQNSISTATTLLENSGKNVAWLAAHTTEKDPMWCWTDGSEIKQFNWADGEPNDFLNNTEDYIQLRREAVYKWNDADGASTYEISDDWSVYKYVCEYQGDCDPSKYTDPNLSLEGSCFVYKAKDYHDAHDGDCQLWTKERMTFHFAKAFCKNRGIDWPDANEVCQKSGGRLAVADTKGKVDWLTTFIWEIAVQKNERKFAGNYWIGGSIDRTAKEMKWNWGGSEDASLPTPSFDKTKNSCGIVSPKGGIEATQCTHSLPALCVKPVSTASTRTCGEPPQALHTKPTSISSGVAGDKIQQECKEKYTPEGDIFCYCLNTGRWHGQCTSSAVCKEIPITTTTTTPATTITTATPTTTTTTPAVTPMPISTPAPVANTTGTSAMTGYSATAVLLVSSTASPLSSPASVLVVNVTTAASSFNTTTP